MKIYDYKSKVMTDYSDSELTLKEIKIKRRLQIAINAMSKVLALRTFKKSKFITL